MGTLTLKPNNVVQWRGTWAANSGTLISALGDDSDASYVTLTGDYPQTYWNHASLVCDFDTAALPFKARVKQAYVRTRIANVDGDTELLSHRMWVRTSETGMGNALGADWPNQRTYNVPNAPTTFNGEPVTTRNDGTLIEQADVDNLSYELYRISQTGTRVYEVRALVEYDAQPTVTIVTPSEGSTLDTTTPLVSWVFNDDLEAQYAYDVDIYSGSTLVYESGEVISGNQYHQFDGTPLPNGTYTMFVRAAQLWHGPGGLFWSEWQRSTFTVSSSSPAAPTISTVDGNGYMQLEVVSNTNLLGLNASTFEEAGHPDWYSFNNMTVSSSASVAHARSGTKVATLVPTGASAAARSEWAPATPGLRYFASVWLRNNPGTAVTSAGVTLAFYNAAGTLISASAGTSSTLVLDTYGERTHAAIAPALTAFVEVRVTLAATSGTYLMDQAYLGLMPTGSTSPNTAQIRGGLLSIERNLINKKDASMGSPFNWYTANAAANTVASSSTQTRNGTTSALVTGVAAGTAYAYLGTGNQTVLDSTTDTISVTPGEILRANGSVYSPVTSRTWHVSVAFYDSTRTYLSESTVSAVSTVGAWREISGNVTAPANAAYARFRMYGLSVGVGEQHYLDRVSLVRDENANGGQWYPGASVITGPTIEVQYTEDGGTTWTDLTTFSPTAADTSLTYRDYEIKHNTDRQYRARTTVVVDDVVFQSAWSATSATNQVSLSNVWLHTIDDPTGTAYNFRFDGGGGRSDSIDVKPEEMVFAGRAYPMVEFGEHTERRVQVTIALASADDQAAFEALVLRKKMCVYRDQRGRRGRGYLSNVSTKDEVWGKEASFNFNFAGSQP